MRNNSHWCDLIFLTTLFCVPKIPGNYKKTVWCREIQGEIRGLGFSFCCASQTQQTCFLLYGQPHFRQWRAPPLPPCLPRHLPPPKRGCVGICLVRRSSPFFPSTSSSPSQSASSAFPPSPSFSTRWVTRSAFHTARTRPASPRPCKQTCPAA